MKLATFQAPGGVSCTVPRIGVEIGQGLLDLRAAWTMLSGAPGRPRDMIDFFAGGQRCLDHARRLVSWAEGLGEDVFDLVGPVAHRHGVVRLLAPVPRPRRIRDYLCYPAHLRLTADYVPEAFAAMPIAWKGNPDTVTGPEEPLLWPAYTDQLDFEFEIGFFVGTEGVDIGVEAASRHIAGVTIFNDVSARDIQFFEMQMGIGPSKGKDFCSAMGPYVVTPDEIDLGDIACEVRVNGEVWSRASTSTAAYSMAEVLAWASHGEPVYSGEFLATGTVDGGCGLELDRWVAPGDVIELDAAGLGVLRNVVGERQRAPQGAGLKSYRGAPRVGGHAHV